MGLLAMRSLWTTQPNNSSATFLGCADFPVTSRKFHGPDDSPKFRVFRPAKIWSIRAFASQKSVKNFRRQRDAQKDLTPQLIKSPSDEEDGLAPGDIVEDSNKESSVENLEVQKSVNIPSRGAVLQACTVTSGLIAALGIVIRQIVENLVIQENKFSRANIYSISISVVGFLMLHPQKDGRSLTALRKYHNVALDFLKWWKSAWNCLHDNIPNYASDYVTTLIAEVVILISSCRYLLLKTWPDFAESSEAANQQVLTLLQPLDYMIVAFLPGVTEELLFRGALLPLFGINWKSALLVAALFGFLHLGSGRKYSFAIWATFVGFVYGFATILSSSLFVPMASHAASNLVGGILWRYTSKLSK